VELNTFVKDQAKNGQPGNTLSYPHLFTASTDGTVSFTPSAVGNPQAGGWIEQIFADPTCTGVLPSSPELLYPPAKLVSVKPGNYCIVLREFIPGGIPAGHINTVTVQASFTFSNAAPALSGTYTVTDITTVGSGALELKKEVRNETQGGTFGINNNAKSGEIIEYRITYTNNGNSPIKGLSIKDATPNHTTFVSAGDSDRPATFTACRKITPANPTTAVDCAEAETEGRKTGVLNFTLDGTLNPGGSGAVLFKVKVD